RPGGGLRAARGHARAGGAHGLRLARQGGAGRGGRHRHRRRRDRPRGAVRARRRRRRRALVRALPRQGVRPLAVRHRHQRQARLPGRRRRAAAGRDVGAGERGGQPLRGALRLGARGRARSGSRARRAARHHRPRARDRRGRAAARPRRRLRLGHPLSRHVVVVGAGIVGLASAYYLRRAGFEVTVLERDPEERATTSHGNAGMVVPSHFVPLAAPGVVAQGLRWMADPRSPFYVKPRLRADLLAWGWRFWRAGTTAHVTRSAPLLLALNLASRDAYVELDAELGGGFAFERQGLTMLCATERGLEEEARVAALAAGLGMRAEVLDGREAQAREPGIELAVAGGVHYPEDAHLDPAAFMRVLQRRLAADGVALRFGTRVAGFEATNGRVEGVRVAAGELVRADHVVLAAGSWTGALARPLGLRLPMQPGKGYSLTLERPSQRLRVPSILAEARVAVTRMGERLRVGGTMELAGFDEGANEARVQGIIGSALRYFPGLARAELETAPRWHGFRPCSPDGLPYLGRSPRHANLTVATGHSMMGVSLALVTGRLVAELVAGEGPGLDVAAVRVDRFG